MKKIKITIDDNLTPEQEVLAIGKKLMQKAISGHGRQPDKVRVGEQVDIKHLNTTIVIERKSKEKTIEMVHCTVCGCEYQSDVFFPVFVNGGVKKQLKYCSEQCQGIVMDICGQDRAVKKKKDLKPLKFW